MSETQFNHGMGWRPDLPDFRDYASDHKEIAPMLKSAGVAKVAGIILPETADLRPWCSRIEDQGYLGSCTAQAGVGIVEYFQRRAFGKHIDASKLFLYKVTRNMLHWVGDTGAYLRTTMGAMAVFGVTPEEYMPYVIADFDNEPSAFCYNYAQKFQAIYYFRYDTPGVSRKDLLGRIKANIAAGVPSMFGFTVYSSITQAGSTGKIPYPVPTDSVCGGHAVVAVGYDDEISIKNIAEGAKATKGALLIRNSWGDRWGDQGYGWLPYEYVLKSLAVDWWSILANDWIDAGVFKL